MLEDHQRLIHRFTGKDAIPLDDAFWNELLAFPFPLSKLNPQEVDAATRQACAQLGEDHGAKLPEFLVSSFTRINGCQVAVVVAIAMKTVRLQKYHSYSGCPALNFHHDTLALPVKHQVSVVGAHPHAPGAVHHNAWTGHFPKLLIHLIRELEGAGSAKELPVKAVNTVYFTRLFVKHLVELYSSDEIGHHLVMRGEDGAPAGERGERHTAYWA